MKQVKRTLKEIANFFDAPVAIDEDGSCFVFCETKKMPTMRGNEWVSDTGYYNHISSPERGIDIDYDGDWKDSLTLPEGWGNDENRKG